MNGYDHKACLYNKGVVTSGEEDLGYFMGYTICKYYYEHSIHPKKAIRRILNLDFGNNNAVYQFFVDSGYEKEMMAMNSRQEKENNQQTLGNRQ